MDFNLLSERKAGGLRKGVRRRWHRTLWHSQSPMFPKPNLTTFASVIADMGESVVDAVYTVRALTAILSQPVVVDEPTVALNSLNTRGGAHVELQVVMESGMGRVQKSTEFPGATTMLVEQMTPASTNFQSTATLQDTADWFVIEIIEAERSAVTEVLDLA